MANQGNHVRPHLLLTTKGPINYPINNKPDGKINFNGVAEDWLHMRDAMVGVVMHGTARRISYGLSYQIAGKTGTAQVVSIAQGKNTMKVRSTIANMTMHYSLHLPLRMRLVSQWPSLWKMVSMAPALRHL